MAKGVMLHTVLVLGCSGRGRTVDVGEGMSWVAPDHVAPEVVNITRLLQSSAAVDVVGMVSAARGVGSSSKAG